MSEELSVRISDTETAYMDDWKCGRCGARVAARKSHGTTQCLQYLNERITLLETKLSLDEIPTVSFEEALHT